MHTFTPSFFVPALLVIVATIVKKPGLTALTYISILVVSYMWFGLLPFISNSGLVWYAFGKIGLAILADLIGSSTSIIHANVFTRGMGMFSWPFTWDKMWRYTYAGPKWNLMAWVFAIFFWTLSFIFEFTKFTGYMEYIYGTLIVLLIIAMMFWNGTQSRYFESDGEKMSKKDRQLRGGYFYIWAIGLAEAVVIYLSQLFRLLPQFIGSHGETFFVQLTALGLVLLFVFITVSILSVLAKQRAQANSASKSIGGKIPFTTNRRS